jgi:hypothetical protein
MKFKWLALVILIVTLAVPAVTPSRTFAATPQDGDYDRDQRGWDAPPPEFREVQRQGFHDGVEGARKDFDHHRMPDVNRREEYRHPHVDAALREDYREGFRRGYDVAMHHLMYQVPQ